MTRQEFTTLDRVRLEIGVPPATDRNYIKNPSGLGGAWGWVTPHAGTSLTGGASDSLHLDPFTSGQTLTFASPSVATGVVTYTETEQFPVAAGQWVKVGIFTPAQTVPAGVSVEISPIFYSAAGAVISQGTIHTTTVFTLSGTRSPAPSQAPAGTVKASIRVQIKRTTTGTRSIAFALAFAYLGASSAAISGLTYSNPYAYVDLLGPHYEISVERSPLGLGILSASSYAADLDPSLGGAFAPGNPVRLIAKTEDEIAPNVWQGIFAGEVLTGSAKYVASRDPSKRARITLSAVDPARTLASIKQPEGVSATGDLRYLLEGCGVPWSINGSTSQPAGSPVVVSRNPNASVLDQIGLARDSTGSQAWINRHGVLVATDNPSATIQAALTEAHYNADIDITYDTDRCINAVTIKRQYLDIDGQTMIEQVLGPYVDQASITARGTYAAEFTVHGVTEAQAQTLAADILTANATPAKVVNRLTLPIKSITDFDYNNSGDRRVFLDLYDRVTVNNTNAGLTPVDLRVVGVTHKITPSKWLMHLDFARAAGAPMPASAPPLPEPAQSFPDTAWTAVTFLNGWTNLASWQAVMYRRKNGIVWIKGTGVPGSLGVPAFNLPAGFRPSDRDIRQGNTNSTSLSAGRFDIQADGNVVPQGAVTWQGFACSFVADQ